MLGNVGGKLDDLERLAVSVKDRIVARLNPNNAAAFADALVLPGIVFAAAELLPEQPIVRALAIGGIDKHGVMVALDLLKRIAESLQEIFICVQNFSIQAEFDNSLHAIDGVHHPSHAGVG